MTRWTWKRFLRNLGDIGRTVLTGGATGLRMLDYDKPIPHLRYGLLLLCGLCMFVQEFLCV